MLLKEWCEPGMKKILRKLFAMVISLGVLCAPVVQACAGQSKVDLSDKKYLLPVDFKVQKQRAIEKNFTKKGYQDSTITVKLGGGRFQDRCDYWTVDVTIKDPSQLRTAPANSKGDFRSKGTRDGVELCNLLNAVVGLNGDFVNGTEKRDYGYVVRQGVLFRDNLDTAGRWNSRLMDVLVIDEDGDFHIVHKAKAGDITDMMIEGKRILNSFCFGPALVMDGKKVEDFENADGWMNMGRDYERQRVAFCQVEPLHYKCICCATHARGSMGMKLKQFANLVAKQGVQTAYNLDGGNSCMMIFGGEKINDPDNPDTRDICDIIYFASAWPG